MNGDRVRVVLQARTGSSRLPGKSLLPLGPQGMPLAVLAALRLGRQGEVVVAIPEGPDEDQLARALSAHEIPIYRGPEHDVLRRFTGAAADLEDTDIVVRATADNVLPDSDFVHELVDALRRSPAMYLGTHSPFDDLPFGLHAEAFRVGLLRRAEAATDDPVDREHVTPWMRRLHGGAPFRPADAPAGLARLRATIDDLQDYRRMADVLSDVADPVGAHWLDLCQRLSARRRTAAYRIPFREVDNLPHGALVVGTVQLGMPYGRLGDVPPVQSEVDEIVHTAISHGVSHFDTARDYGRSETALGAALAVHRPGHVRVVTKLSPLRELPETASEAEIDAAVDASIYRSLLELRTRSLDTLLLHRARHLHSHGGAVWRRVLTHRSEGRIARVGVSVQSVEEAWESLGHPEVQHIQLPFNLLDWRWKEAGIPEALLGRRGMVVHARTVLLQGLLVQGTEHLWPPVAGVDPAAVLQTIRGLVRDLNRENTVDLALAYVRGQDWITGVMIGVSRLAQMRLNLDYARRTPLSREEQRHVEEAFQRVAPVGLLDPARWEEAER